MQETEAAAAVQQHSSENSWRCLLCLFHPSALLAVSSLADELEVGKLGGIGIWGRGEDAMTCPAELVSGPCISSTWDESHSSTLCRRLAGVRRGVGGGETLRVNCLKFGRDTQYSVVSLVWARAHWLGTPVVEAVEGGPEGARHSSVCFVFVDGMCVHHVAGSPDPGSQNENNQIKTRLGLQQGVTLSTCCRSLVLLTRIASHDDDDVDVVAAVGFGSHGAQNRTVWDRTGKVPTYTTDT